VDKIRNYFHVNSKGGTWLDSCQSVTELTVTTKKTGFNFLSGRIFLSLPSPPDGF